jgi:hypothetical protein
MAAGLKHRAFKTTTGKSGLLNKTRPRSLKSLTTMTAKTINDGRNKSTVALVVPSNSIIRAEINIATMANEALTSITEVDTKGTTGTISRNLTGASITFNAVTLIDLMHQIKIGMLTAEKPLLKVFNSSTNKVTRAARHEAGLTKEATIAGLKCSEIITNFMTATIKKIRVLILKKLEVKELKSLANSRSVTSMNGL